MKKLLTNKKFWATVAGVVLGAAAVTVAVKKVKLEEIED